MEDEKCTVCGQPPGDHIFPLKTGSCFTFCLVPPDPEPQLPGGNGPHTAEIAELRQRVALLERRLADVERKGSR